MFQIHPTWLVGLEGKTYRVPEPDLEAFLRVLVFNRVDTFDVEQEASKTYSDDEILGRSPTEGASDASDQ